MRDGAVLVGWGMASATYPANRSKAEARLVFGNDGSVLAQSGTQDLGTGTYTVMSQVAADALKLPLHQIRFDLADSRFPPAPISGGSQTAASVAPADPAREDLGVGAPSGSGRYSRSASGKGKPNSNGMAMPWNHCGSGGKRPTAAIISATRLSMSGIARAAPHLCQHDLPVIEHEKLDDRHAAAIAQFGQRQQVVMLADQRMHIGEVFVPRRRRPGEPCPPGSRFAGSSTRRGA